MKKPNMNDLDSGPWYRQPWPWILAAGPAIVVVAAFYTAWLAVKSNDGLVTDDYYKKGLSANQTIARSEQATRMGLVAGVRIAGDTLSVRLQASEKGFLMPSTLALTISHPTRAGLDLAAAGERDSARQWRNAHRQFRGTCRSSGARGHPQLNLSTARRQHHGSLETVDWQ